MELGAFLAQHDFFEGTRDRVERARNEQVVIVLVCLAVLDNHYGYSMCKFLRVSGSDLASSVTPEYRDGPLSIRLPLPKPLHGSHKSSPRLFRFICFFKLPVVPSHEGGRDRPPPSLGYWCNTTSPRFLRRKPPMQKRYSITSKRTS